MNLVLADLRRFTPIEAPMFAEKLSIYGNRRKESANIGVRKSAEQFYVVNRFRRFGFSVA